jgi:tetratricopeptide (TPR) repeat protein
MMPYMVGFVKRFSIFAVLFLTACGGGTPVRQAAYPIDCRQGMPIKDLLQRGDSHRDRLMQETGPENIDPEQWQQVRKVHGLRARTCYQNVLDEKPDSAYALENIGFTYIVESTLPEQTPEARDKDLINATNFFRQALDAQHLDSQAYFYLGEIAARRGQCEKAMRIFNALISSRWNYSHVYVWMGYCDETMGDAEGAKQNYRKAAEISNPIAIAEWARSKYK